MEDITLRENRSFIMPELTYNTTSDKQLVADAIAKVITAQLQAGHKVLWLVPGGSAIAVAVLVAQQLREIEHSGLAVSLTDERYGPVGYVDSNWQQLVLAGFSLPQARLLPVLTGADLAETTLRFDTILQHELTTADYSIGVFGIGPDGHTAGILPGSPAVHATDLAAAYSTPQFERVTMTPVAIAQLDEAIVFAVGSEKWPTLQALGMVNNIDVQPAQVLKQVPRLTIYSDYKEGVV